MAYPIERKLVVAVSSSALFDLSEEEAVFQRSGLKEYREIQRARQDIALKKGPAFPFIRRFLHLNTLHERTQPVEVVLLSQNNPDSGLRIFNSIEHHKLGITRAAFLNGHLPYKYIGPFNVSLFLSANYEDVKTAVDKGFPAGIVLGGMIEDDPNDTELRVAFDFDGVIADDEAEKVYAEKEELGLFQQHETEKADIPLMQGPLKDLFQKLSFFQNYERKLHEQDSSYKRNLRISIVTARNAPAHKRVITTLRKWGVEPDEAFFLGGIEKKRVLEQLRPHIFFDDQLTHLELKESNIPAVHVPFGIRNKRKSE